MLVSFYFPKQIDLKKIKQKEIQMFSFRFLLLFWRVIFVLPVVYIGNL